MVIRRGFVTEVAPIVKWARGKSWEYVKDYFLRKGFKINIL